ncbi:MAG TPA: hypothetical protein ENI27_09235 [bacterium]|nr:hypothetical protein [bacterium]
MLPKKCPITKPKRKRTPKKNLEGRVVKDCLLALHNCPDVIYVERRNTGSLEIEDGGWITFGSPGAADIWCLAKVHLKEMIVPENENDPYEFRPSDSFLVKHVEIECKRADGKGRQSEIQKEFQESCDNHNIPYILTTSAVDMIEKLYRILS